MVVGRLILLRFLEPVGAARQRARPPGHPPDQPRHSVRLAGFEPATPAWGERRKTRVKPRTCGNACRECRRCNGYTDFTDLALTWRRRRPGLVGRAVMPMSGRGTRPSVRV